MEQGGVDGVKKYKAKNWGSNAFFSKYRYIQEKTKDLDSYVVWTELLKCDSGEKGSSRNSNHIKSIVELSIKTLKQEIDILKPDLNKNVLERKHLHKIIAKETWLFGDEYTYGVDDVSLKNVLKANLQYIGRSDFEEIVNSEDNEELNEIPDVCLWRQYSL